MNKKFALNVFSVLAIFLSATFANLVSADSTVKDLLLSKREQVEAIAKELLKKEILFKVDLERIIGNRPYEIKEHEVELVSVEESKFEDEIALDEV